MPRGPRGEKRPADTIGCAVMVAKIATGEIEEHLDQSEEPERVEPTYVTWPRRFRKASGEVSEQVALHPDY